MTRSVLILLLLIGAWWSLLLTDWVVVDGQGIIGADLNQTMALLPAVAALSLLISLYRKLPKLLVAVGAVTIGLTSSIALFGGLASSPAVIEAREQVSGIAGGGDVSIATSPVIAIFGIIGFALLLATASLIFLKPRRTASTGEPRELDSRDLWDEQS